MSQSTRSADEGHGPWWESDIAALQSRGTRAAAPSPTQPGSTDRPDATVVDLTARRPADTASPVSPVSPAAPTTPALISPSGGVTARGTFLIMVIASAAGCLVGFLLSGLTVVPALAGYGLVVGSVLGALICSPRLGWFPVWLPPLAFVVVVITLGQLTLLGSGLSTTREAAMILSTLTAQAPAQVLSVVAVAGILFVRRRRAS